MLVSLLVGGACTSSYAAADAPAPVVPLTPQQSKRVDDAVDRALAWLARQQRRNGSFAAPSTGQPGITSLCVMAFLSRGHLPGTGPYGRNIDAGVRFALGCQQRDGLFSYARPGPTHGFLNVAHAATYNHAITGLMLSEVYGMTKSADASRIREAIDKAIPFTLLCHPRPKPKRVPIERGAWRYLRPYGLNDADLSITSWQILFLRSARNAGFKVPISHINDALAYVKASFDSQRETFIYELIAEEPHLNHTRAMAGAGILALSLSGMHDTAMARATGEWILRHPFTQYDRPIEGEEWHCYSAFYCSQAMFQLGGRYWSEFYKTLSRTLLAHQSEDGSWRPSGGKDRRFGYAYTTALTVLALSPPYQLLPIFQR